MFKRFLVAALTVALSVAPAFAEQVIQAQPQPGTIRATPAPAPVVPAAPAPGSAVVTGTGLTTATVTVAPSTESQTFEIPVKTFVDGIMPYVVSAVGALISVLATLATIWLKQKFNIDIQEKDRKTFQDAATNAAGAIIARGAVAVEQESGKFVIKNDTMADVMNSLASRIPDALKRLGVTPEQIESTIMAKVPQVLTGATPSAAAAIPPAK